MSLLLVNAVQGSDYGYLEMTTKKLAKVSLLRRNFIVYVTWTLDFGEGIGYVDQFSVCDGLWMDQRDQIFLFIVSLSSYVSSSS